MRLGNRARSSWRTALAAAALAGVIGCDEGTTATPDAGGTLPDSSAGETARVRVLHLSPDAPAVSVYANDGADPVVATLEFPSGTDYLAVPAGTYDFDVSPAGAGAAGSVLAIDDLALAAGGSYTAVAIGTIAGGATPLAALALADEDEAPPAGQLRIRAIHAAAGIGQVDIWNIPATGDPTPIVTDLDYGTAADPINLPTGTYTIGIDVDDDATPDVVFVAPLSLAGAYINVFAARETDGDVFLLAQLPTGATLRIDPTPPAAARLRVMHLSPDAPDVDVFVDAAATPAFDAVAFPEGTAYAELPAGSYDIDVSADGSPAADAVLSVADLALASGTAYTAVALGRVSGLPALAALPLVDDLSAPPAGQIRVRAVHAAAGVGQVDVWNIPATGDPTPLFQNLDYASASAYAEIPAAGYTLGIDADDDGTPDFTFVIPAAALPAGTIANVFAVAPTSGAPFLVAEFADGTTARIDAE